MISQTAEYALRAIVYLADHPGEAHTTEQIARATKIPVGYLAKIMQGLARSRLVASQRGLHGGFTLIKAAHELSIYDVVQAVDPILRIDRCPMSLENHGGQLCPLHTALDAAMAQVETMFRKAMIADLLSGPAHLHPLCAFPPNPNKKV